MDEINGESWPGRSIIEAFPDPCFVVEGRNGKIIHVNEGATKLLDRPADDIRNTHVREFFPPGAQADALFDRLELDDYAIGPMEYYQDGRPIAVQRPDGTTLPVRVTDRPLSGRDHHLIVMQNRATVRLQNQRRAVAHRLLRHNLRNELTAIRMIGEHLHETVDENQRQYTEELLAACDTLLSVSDKAHAANQVIDVDEVVIEVVDVAEAIGTIVDKLQMDHPEALIQVDVDDGMTVTTVPEAFSEAIRNIVENAIVHNEDETPVVSISVSELVDGLEIEVEDNGPGIPEHERTVVRTGSESPLEHGSGIGLWLVKWSVNLANGDVFFEETSEGTRVILWFPTMED